MYKRALVNTLAVFMIFGAIGVTIAESPLSLLLFSLICLSIFCGCHILMASFRVRTHTLPVSLMAYFGRELGFNVPFLLTLLVLADPAGPGLWWRGPANVIGWFFSVSLAYWLAVKVYSNR